MVISEAYAQLIFLDANGNFCGAPPMSDLVYLRTGLNFEMTRAPSVTEIMKPVSDGQADLIVIGTLIPSDELESRFSFSHPYLDSSWIELLRNTR